MKSLFNLEPLAQQAPPLPLQPQGGSAPVPGQPVNGTGAGTPAAPVPFQRGQPVGFFTDTTLCIGCKACEVACKEWNQLPSTNGGLNTLSGDSYDNTRRLDGIHWRH